MSRTRHAAVVAAAAARAGKVLVGRAGGAAAARLARVVGGVRTRAREELPRSATGFARDAVHARRCVGVVVARGADTLGDRRGAGRRRRGERGAGFAGVVRLAATASVDVLVLQAGGAGLGLQPRPRFIGYYCEDLAGSFYFRDLTSTR